MDLEALQELCKRKDREKSFLQQENEELTADIVQRLRDIKKFKRLLEDLLHGSTNTKAKAGERAAALLHSPAPGGEVQMFNATARKVSANLKSRLEQSPTAQVSPGQGVCMRLELDGAEGEGNPARASTGSVGPRQAVSAGAHQHDSGSKGRRSKSLRVTFVGEASPGMQDGSVLSQRSPQRSDQCTPVGAGGERSDSSRAHQGECAWEEEWASQGSWYRCLREREEEQGYSPEEIVTWALDIVCDPVPRSLRLPLYAAACLSRAKPHLSLEERARVDDAIRGNDQAFLFCQCVDFALTDECMVEAMVIILSLGPARPTEEGGAQRPTEEGVRWAMEILQHNAKKGLLQERAVGLLERELQRHSRGSLGPVASGGSVAPRGSIPGSGEAETRASSGSEGPGGLTTDADEAEVDAAAPQAAARSELPPHFASPGTSGQRRAPFSVDDRVTNIGGMGVRQGVTMEETVDISAKPASSTLKSPVQQGDGGTQQQVQQPAEESADALDFWGEFSEEELTRAMAQPGFQPRTFYASSGKTLVKDVPRKPPGKNGKPKRTWHPFQRRVAVEFCTEHAAELQAGSELANRELYLQLARELGFNAAEYSSEACGTTEQRRSWKSFLQTVRRWLMEAQQAQARAHQQQGQQAQQAEAQQAEQQLGQDEPYATECCRGLDALCRSWGT